MPLTRRLPRDVTSYDLLKTLAVIFMIIDHVGYYFYGEENAYRIVGRGCAFILFFLIGYARTRELQTRLWIGFFILEAGHFTAGLPIFPVNILISFLLIRFTIDKLMGHVIAKPAIFWAVNLGLLLFALPSLLVVDYGTEGMSIAMLGWIIRQHQSGNPLATQDKAYAQGLCAAINYIFWETVSFGFNQGEMVVLSLLIIPILFMLMFFRPAAFPVFDAGILAPLKGALQFCGRWTLEIYVIHILVFQTLASYIDPERFPPFRLIWMQI